MALALACGGAACAPSPRLVHQGNIYFEHCYGGDLDPQVPDADKEACWTAWLAHYTRHQPGHRIDYAMRRVEALQMGTDGPRLPDLRGGSDQPGAWPPAVGSTAPADGEEEAPSGAASQRTRGDVPHGCQAVCDDARATCQKECKERPDWCEQRCERERVLCMGGCY